MEKIIEIEDSIEDYSFDIEHNLNIAEITKAENLIDVHTLGKSDYFLVSTNDYINWRGIKSTTSSIYNYLTKSRCKYIIVNVALKDRSYMEVNIYTFGSLNKFPVQYSDCYDNPKPLPVYRISKNDGIKTKDYIDAIHVQNYGFSKTNRSEYLRYFNLFDDSYNKALTLITPTLDLFFEGDWSFDKVSTIKDNKCAIPNDGTHDNSVYALTIRFPEVIIKNSEYKKTKAYHEIKDLYVIAYFTKDLLLLRGLWGKRQAITAAEYQASYAHSHIPANKSEHINMFCLGHNGNPIKDVCNDMCCDPLNEELLERFCLHLSFVRYESLEGTPHIRFSNVIPTGKVPYNPGNIDADVKEVLTKIDRTIPFIVNNTTSPIKVDENNTAFNSYLDSLTTDNLKCIVENGNGFRLSNNKIDPTDIKKGFANYKKLYFKGQCLPMVLLEDENTDTVVEGMLPSAKKTILKKLEDQANMLLLNINYYEHRSRETN